MQVYLRDIPFEAAWERWQQALDSWGLFQQLPAEDCELNETLVGRILAEPVWAKICSPHYHASAMDGYAVHADTLLDASANTPVALRVAEQARYVDTGDLLPAEMNCVLPIETIEALDGDGMPAADIRKASVIRVRSTVPPWSSVRLMGEDLVASQLVLPAGHILRPFDLGALAASGNSTVKVVRKPVVEIIPTGTELIKIGDPITPGDIIEFNSLVLAAQIQTWGAVTHRHPIVVDDFKLIRAAVADAASRSDLVVLNAGSSAGSEDFSARIVEELGDLLVHGVAIRPGHPVILGMIRVPDQPDRMIPLIGVPGYPVSAALTAEIFIQPLISIWMGLAAESPRLLEAKLTQKVNSPAGDDDYIRVMAGRVGDEMIAAPLPRGAGVITSLVKADGLLVVPRGIQGLEAGERVKIRLMRSPDIFERTLFFSGSHDITLDLLSAALYPQNIRVVCTNVGSLGGMVALRRKEAHAAGSHLLDPASGEYNTTYIRQYLNEIPVAVVKWVGREQGLIVKRGNPKGIHSLQDLARPDVRFINRQRGAGTRVLLDYNLIQLGIDTGLVNGYGLEEYTHLAVAAAVVSDRADCGLGITAAASALDCDFIPLYQEQYELIIPAAYLKLDMFQAMIEVGQSPAFRNEIRKLGGYEADHTGEIRIHLSA